MIRLFCRLLLVPVLICLHAGAGAQALPADVAGGKDHPVLSRYAGSWLVATENRAFDAIAMPAGPKEGDVVKLEGRIVRNYYLAPAGRSVLEVQRNYEQALERAGAVRRDACVMPSCGARGFRAFDGRQGKQLASGELKGWSPVSLIDQWIDHDSVRWWYGTLKVQGSTLHVAVLSARQGLVDLAGQHVATVIQIVQPQAMEEGQVTVDAQALARDLQAEGRVALYGLYFDTGKAELKPEIQAQVAEMAQLLKRNTALRVFLVGHTDNQGTLEGNLALSRARAQAVVDALVKLHKIEPRRLSAAGVASYAPVASNAGDEGRARNRRVELVLQ